VDPVLERLLEDYPPEMRDDPDLHEAIRGCYRYQHDTLVAQVHELIRDSNWATRRLGGALLVKLDRLDRTVASGRDAAIRKYLDS
jgi:hypothetical protein